MDAEVAGWKVSLNDRAPAPEPQDTLQIAAAVRRCGAATLGARECFSWCGRALS